MAILVRAQALLSSNAVWNRADERECKDDEVSGERSLFCALQKACIDVLGSYDHRRVAPWLLRRIRVSARLKTKRPGTAITGTFAQGSDQMPFNLARPTPENRVGDSGKCGSGLWNRRVDARPVYSDRAFAA